MRYEHQRATASRIGSVIALVFVIVAGLAALVQLWQVTGPGSEAGWAGVAIFAVTAAAVAALIGPAAWFLAVAAGQRTGQHPGLILTTQGAAVGAPGRRATMTVRWPMVPEVRALRLGLRTQVLIMAGKKSVPVHLELDGDQLYALVSSAHRMFAPPAR